jgi:hypothetical protein
MGASQYCLKIQGESQPFELESEIPVRYSTITIQSTLFNEMIMKGLSDTCMLEEENYSSEIVFQKLDKKLEQAEMIDYFTPQTPEIIENHSKKQTSKELIIKTPKEQLQDFWQENIIHERVSEDLINEAHLSEIFSRSRLIIDLEVQVENTVYPMCEALNLPKLGVFKGELNIDQEPHGRGFLFLQDDSTFVGYFKNGFPEGPGKLLDNEKVLREGNFVTLAQGTRKSVSKKYLKKDKINIVLHGQGIESWPNRIFYDGNFEYGVKEGEGKLEYFDGRYEGHFSNDVFDGFGKFLFKNGDVYEGEWKNGIKHGDGILKAKNGSVYKGKFLDGERNGNGTMVWPDKRVYDGQWRDGKKHGIAKYSFFDVKKNRMRSSYCEWNDGVKVRWVKKNEIQDIV